MATATTIIVPTEKDMNVLVTGKEHAGHRDQDGDARDEHGVTRGRGGRLERSALAAARGALFALTPHVEQGVVHSDREADEQDHFHDVLAGRRCPGSRRRRGRTLPRRT